MIPEKYRKDIKILQDVAQQINRDLGMKDFEIVFSGDTTNAFEELKSQLLPVVTRVFNEDKPFFQSLLYRVDIREKDYKDVLNKNATKQISEALTEIIIQREFQKVITRIYFSEKGQK